MLLRDDVESTLRKSPLFAAMSASDLHEVLEDFDEQVFPAGHRIVVEGMVGQEFFVILAGTADVLIEGTRVATLEPGDFFGETAMLGGTPRTASVVARTQLSCVCLPNASVLRVVTQRPRLVVNLVATLVGRLRRADAELARRNAVPVLEVLRPLAGPASS